MNEQNILHAVSIEKDVDGFHPLNIGRLAMRGEEPLFVPCTPKGCIELLHRYNIGIKGKRAVVIGRSNIVGTPAALLLQVRFYLLIYYLFIFLSTSIIDSNIYNAIDYRFCLITFVISSREKMQRSALFILEPKTLKS